MKMITKSVLDMQSQRKEIIIKATHKDKLDKVIEHFGSRYL